MQVSFDELKALYQSLYVNVDDLIVSKQDATAEELKWSEIAWNRLELISKLAAEMYKYREVSF